MSIQLPFSNNAIQVFAYERFNYVISNPDIGLYPTMLNVSNSSGFGANPSLVYFTKNGNSNMTFAISDLSNNLTAGTTEAFAVTVTDGSASRVSSNIVTIGAGRFLDGSGASLSNNVYTFFKNEAITPIRLVAPSFTLALPTSIPALPPGLSFSSNASNEYRIVGSPLLPIASTSYQIIGVQSGGSKIVTTRFNIVVSNERLRVDPAFGAIISNMQIGTAITPIVITSIPPLTGGLVRYTFPVLPDGIIVKDVSGTPQPPGITSFQPSDSSYTMIIEGTPTLTAAEAFRNAGATSNGLPYTILATRFSPLPLLSNTIPLIFQFAPTVLFDTPSLTSNYVGIPIDQSANFFRAQTYFTNNFDLSGISNIFSPDLRSDLSLVYVPGSSRADLSGNNPLTAGSASYIIRAINSNGLSQDYSVVIPISNDVVSFVSPTPMADTCYTFILSRPLTSFKDGYYSSNIRFVATAASGRSVVLSAPALTGTGLSLDTSGTITGLPTQVTPLTTLTVTASAVGSPATDSRDIRFSILNDAFEFTDVSANRLTFVENVPIAPVQFPVTTLSDRNVIGYSLIGFPNGLTIDPTGLVSGTPTTSSPTAGNGTITATTGYASGSRDFSYNITPESILFTFPQNIYQYEAGDPVSIQVTGTAYSGATVGNYAIDFPPSYGLTINPTTGLISGTWTNSIPPNQLLFADQSFNVTGQVNSVIGASLVDVSAGPIIQNTSFVWAGGSFFSSNHTTSWVKNTSVSNSAFGSGFDIVIKNSNVDGNFILATQVDAIYRSTNANDFTRISIADIGGFQRVSSLAFKPGTTTWWASGLGGEFGAANIIESDDNGLTWYGKSDIRESTNGFRVASRISNTSGMSNIPYMYPGIALKYSDGVLLAGGSEFAGYSMLRSIDDGATWNEVSNALGSEIAYLNLDVSGMWISTGSHLYSSARTFVLGQPAVNFGAPVPTIRYSTNRGQQWSNTSGDFGLFGYELVYGNNTWVASGIDLGTAFFGPQPYSVFTIRLKYSTDGINWSNVSGVPPIDVSDVTIFPPASVPPRTLPPLPMGSMNYDGSNWNVFTQTQDPCGTWVSKVYSSPTIDAPSWPSVTVSFPEISQNENRRFVTYTRAQYLRPSASRIIDITLTTNSDLGAGPSISPPSSSFLLYQYVPASLQLSATGTGQIYFFISTDDLPAGLTFNPVTNIISGRPAEQGRFTTTVYARDDNGVTEVQYTFTVNIPRVIRKQDGAGAYTSLLKQYTEVLAAQSARDSKALPTQLVRLGEFMSPVPVAVTTKTFNTNCQNCFREECPVTNAIVDANGAVTAICDFIDANSGDVFDAGNAEPNICD